MKRALVVLFLLFLVFSLSAQRSLRAEWVDSIKGLSSPGITCLLKDSTGFVWIGTGNGLNRWDGHECRIFKDELPNQYITCLFEDSRRMLWIGTQFGLSRYDPATGAFYSFFSEDRINKVVNAVSEDATGRLWAVLNEGVFRLEKGGKEFQFDGSASGLLAVTASAKYAHNNWMKDIATCLSCDGSGREHRVALL